MATATIASLALSSITMDPTDNYRWKSKEAMEHDLATVVEKDEESETTVNKFEALVNSVKHSGVHSPIHVQPVGNKYKVVIGFHRYLAAVKAGLKNIPAVIEDENADTELLRVKQVAENSQDLRRAIAWVTETAAWKRMREAAHARFAKMLPSERTDPSTGRAIPPATMAARFVATSLAVTPEKVNQRIALLDILPEAIVNLAAARSWSTRICKEFIFGDNGDRLTDDVIGKLIDEVKRSDKQFRNVTPRAVSRARARVLARLAAGKYNTGKCAWRTGTNNTDVEQPVMEAQGLTPAAFRDVSINLAAQALTRLKLTMSSSSADLDKIKTTVEWVLICGIGIGANEARIRAGCESMVDRANFDDVLPRTNHYASTAAVGALLRAAVQARGIGSWAAWFGATTERAGVKRANRVAFVAAVRAGAERGASLKDMADKAWEELLISGCMPTLRAAAVAQ